MTRRSTRSARAAAALTRDMMLAPAVVAMRLPLLADESGLVHPFRVETVRAVTEKTAAAMEGLFAAQASMMLSASRFWFELYSGRTPSLFNGEAVERAMHAAFTPSGLEVRKNYRRLSAKRR